MSRLKVSVLSVQGKIELTYCWAYYADTRSLKQDGYDRDDAFNQLFLNKIFAISLRRVPITESEQARNVPKYSHRQ